MSRRPRRKHKRFGKRNAEPAAVFDETDLGAVHLAAFGFAAQLGGDFGDHRQSRCRDRMAFRNEAAGGVDREAGAEGRRAGLNKAPASALRQNRSISIW
jgi:hypothetical protein